MYFSTNFDKFVFFINEQISTSIIIKVTFFNDSQKFLKVISPKINVYKILYLIYRFNTYILYTFP